MDSGEIKTPQEWLSLILSGHIFMHEAPPSIQSWARFPIYQGAVELLRMDTADERRAALQKVPPLIRPYVEDELRRIWPYRAQLRH